MAEAAEQQPFLSGTANAAGGLGQLQDQVWEEVRRAIKLTNQTEVFWDNLMAFLHAVDWTETWIRGILAGHVAIFLLVLLCRRNTGVLSGVFLLLGALVYFGENINSVAGQHWQAFARQDYFDEHGIFYSSIVSGPAIITLLMVLVFYLLQATSLMVQVKKKEIIHKARQRAKAEAGAKKQQ